MLVKKNHIMLKFEVISNEFWFATILRMFRNLHDLAAFIQIGKKASYCHF